MLHTDKEYCIEVSGDFACFTRPEMKVERVSYDIITPSAARNIFQAIFFVKGAMRWEVTRIEVLNPIRRFSIRRNEVKALMNPKANFVDCEKERTQRMAYILRDVRYRIFAKLVFIPLAQRSKKDQEITRKKLAEKGTEDENPGKYYGQFERRISKGGCYHMPYLGCREYSCHFEWIPDATYQTGIPESRNLGFMLYDMDFSNEKNPQPMFFEAIMTDGVITVPPINSEKILR